MARRTQYERYFVRDGATSTMVSTWTHSRSARAAARALRAKDGHGYYVWDAETGKVLLDLLPTKLVVAMIHTSDSEWQADETAERWRKEGTYARVRTSTATGMFGNTRYTVRAYRKVT